MKNRWIGEGVAIIGLLGLCVGCPGGPSKEPPAVPTGAEDATTRPAEGTEAGTMPDGLPASSYDLALSTQDGVNIYGTGYPTVGETPAPAVLLVHGRGQTRAVWPPFAETLRQAGYVVLSIDLRGHGQSRHKANGERMPGYRRMDPKQWNGAVEDLRAAYNHLIARPDVDEESVALVGSDVGANLALNFAGGETGVKALVLLSPGREYEGVRSEDGQANYGERPMFLAFSKDDRESAEVMEEFILLARQPEGDLRVKELERAGHGTEMLKREKTLTPDMVSWLNQYLAGATE